MQMGNEGGTEEIPVEEQGTGIYDRCELRRGPKEMVLVTLTNGWNSRESVVEN